MLKNTKSVTLQKMKSKKENVKTLLWCIEKQSINSKVYNYIAFHEGEKEKVVPAKFNVPLGMALMFL